MFVVENLLANGRRENLCRFWKINDRSEFE